ncbi:hypothetical protein BIV23_28025 [Streptomyces monashensis]|uniref:Uncharacterized protein n=1 Tax=Streptomyces monashensis TaxID=1678012 RepID=A0A1S2Q242_9ACTN|nr:hypothetical protein BIV23_28025 [Streptomyces monashensis]
MLHTRLLRGIGGAPTQARADLRRAAKAGEPVGDELIDALVLPLVEKSVPEWWPSAAPTGWYRRWPVPP